MQTNVIYNKSCLTMEEIEDNSIDTIVTSCPYWGLRDYGKEANQIWDGNKDCEHQWGNSIPRKYHKPGETNPGKEGYTKNVGAWGQTSGQFCQLCGAWYGQLGLEPTLEMYIEHLLLITAECKRVLKPTGVLWWNHGDSYFTGKGSCNNPGGGNKSWKSWNDRKAIFPRGRGAPNRMSKEIPAKCLALQNFRLILRLIDEQGWVLRNTAIWNKPNSMPSSTKDRLTNKYEPVFFLVKNTKTQYYWNEKTGLMANRKSSPLQENIDWEWIECPKCNGVAKIIEGIKAGEMILGLFFPKKGPEICPRCKGTRKIKHSFWHSLDYWFDLDAIREKQLEPNAIRPHMGQGNQMVYNQKRKGIQVPGQSAQGIHRKRHSGYYGVNGEYLVNPSGKNPGDILSIEEAIDFPIFAVEEHTTILRIKEFEDFSNFVSTIINKLIDSSFTMQLGDNNSNATKLSEDVRNFREQFLSARPMQPNLISIASNPYATITIKQSSNEISIEFGRNRWIFCNKSFSNFDSQSNQIKSHFFAVNAKRENAPLFVLVNWMSGLPLALDIINQFNVSRGKSNSITGITLHNTSISQQQAQDISRMVSNFSKVFFVESMLAVALNYCRISVSEPSFIMKGTESTSPVFSLTKGTFPHIISITDFDNNINTSGDVWTIPTQPYPEAHFATFPEKLIIKPILSSCPEWICKKCGKARVRISKVNYNGSIDNSYKSKRWGDQKDPTSKVSKKVNAEHNTIGWTDCGCNVGWRAGIILDPFAGRGTTLAMAKRFDRQFIGYEIVKSYIPLIRKSLEKEDTMFNRDLKEQFV